MLFLKLKTPQIRELRLTFRSFCKTSDAHEYVKLCQWRSLKEFSDFLTSIVTYNCDDLVVLNKPYGVSLRPYQSSENDNQVLRTLPLSGSQYTLIEALPHLAKNLGYSSLTVIKAPERYNSGVTVLTPNEKVADKVRKCLIRGNGSGMFCAHYWAVVLGSPQPKSGTNKIGLTLEQNPLNKKDKKPVVVTKWSKNSVKNGTVKVFRVRHNTLYQHNLASLVEISPSATKWHFLRVYMAHMMSPVLGDNLYGSRVHHLFDVPVAVNPFSDAAKGPQKLQQDIKTILQIHPEQALIVPVHLHLQKLVIPHYFAKCHDLEIEVAPPRSFEWTCSCLGLMEPTDDVEMETCT